MDDGLIDDSLPPFADPWEALAEAAAVLMPPKRILVSEAAARYREVHSAAYNGPWRNSVAPYMVEPMDATIRADLEAVVFCGPAQSLKTDALIINKIVHAVTCVPCDTRVIHMDPVSARNFGKIRLDRLSRESLEYRARLSPGRHDDNIRDKRFQNMMLTVAHPTVNNLSSESIVTMLLTDVDRMSDNVDGEGSPFSLARQRTKTFGSKGMTVAESSPGRDLTNPAWVPATPHEAPPVSGILGLYNMGDRRRWMWRCPQCGHGFEPHFGLFHYPQDASPAKAAASVCLPCPACGLPIDQSMRRELNEAGLWLREGQRFDPDGAVTGDGLVSRIGSFWLRGPAAAFADWSSMVERYLSAKQEYERSGDEGPLRSTVNTDQADVYMPQAIAARAAGGLLTAEALRNRAEDYPVGVVPEGALFLVVAVDGQGSRFVIQVEAFGPHLERWVIDRFDVVMPPSGERRSLDPARYLEDWDALEAAVLGKGWPMAARPGFVMKPVLVVFDSNGPAGYTGQAYDWWRKHRKTHGKRLLPLRGEPGFKAARVAMTYPDSERKDRHAGARGEVPVLRMAVDRLKDMVDAGLRRDVPGPGYIHLSFGMDDTGRATRLPVTLFDEYVAEVRGERGWEKVAVRNESLDLSAYATGAALYLGADEIQWERPETWPVWCRPDGNPYIGPAAPTAEPPGPATPGGVDAPPPEDDAQARAARMLAGFMGG